MEIILKQDIHTLGYKNDIVTVKNGYGRNYLIPTGMATLATPSARKMHAENMRQSAHKQEKIKNEALELAKKLEAVSLSIGAKTSTTGKIFGSVNNIQISEALAAQGFEIDRKVIAIKDAVKEIGKYTASVKLHKEVKVDIAFEVVSE
ncbi:50S ribosomal protein L9 [Ancylomarina euxinus]|uniref:Large ribosomal subunit protein bL9 n=1 Tax=Ancylomarina euxinus TaxID=2283627 RepID=A0A425Y239_9BACT|nr:50S ribosomal protein L9 [Ancylomarina euxinus]MCZ4695067.1 50S ribosomal protein L9 [Ancylomarina euxinus]MUP14997.1 50S ribosomal protein L9 [Ancylomarina euxinus]RRG21886.1 50S ribosomal protein L9 [Ancylomarina euxinus]